MEKDAYVRFYNYLCEVVSFYQKHKSLKFFTLIAKKYKVSAITKDTFYSYDLHKIPEGTVPSRELSDAIRNAMLKEKEESRNKVNLIKGETVAWNNNGFRSIAVIDEGLSFLICLNYRGKEDEQDRLWMFDSIPEDVALERANVSDLKKLVSVLLDCYIHESSEE